MKTIKPIPSITIQMGDQKTELLRQEILKDPTLGDLLTNYERLLNEHAELEYEVLKMAHARNSMHNELQRQAVAYVEKKNAPEPEEEEENTDESA